MNNITISLSNEDRARLDRLTDFLEKRIAQVNKVYATCLERTPAEVTETAPQEAQTEEPKELAQPEPEEPAEAKIEEPKPTPKVTVEDIRSKVLALTAAGKKEELKEIIKSYASKVSEIPEELLAEVLQKLDALEG